MTGAKRKSGKFTNIFFILLALILVSYYVMESDYFSETKDNKNENTKLNQDSTIKSIRVKNNINERNIPIDTTAQIILLCGDSMADGLFNPFRDYANYNGHLLSFSNWGSSTTTAWVFTNKMKKMIEKYKPTYIILELGSNELSTTMLDELERNVKSILKQADGIKFIWVGPHNWKDDNGLNDILEKTLGKGKYFSSKDLVIERGQDGIHPTVRGYEQWAVKIAEWIENKSDYPIRIITPPENTTEK